MFLLKKMHILICKIFCMITYLENDLYKHGIKLCVLIVVIICDQCNLVPLMKKTEDRLL